MDAIDAIVVPLSSDTVIVKRRAPRRETPAQGMLESQNGTATRSSLPLSRIFLMTLVVIIYPLLRAVEAIVSRRYRSRHGGGDWATS